MKHRCLPRLAPISLAVLALAQAQIGHGADGTEPFGRLQDTVARILEREGVPVRQPAISPPANRATASAAESAVSERQISAQEQREVEGLVVVFASAEARELSRQNLAPPAALQDELELAAGVPLSFKRAMALGGFVFSFTDGAMNGTRVEPVLQRLRQLDSIESVYPDTREQPRFTPNDAYINYQWSLFPDQWYAAELDARTVGIGAVDAWDISTGSSDIVVAVVDSGLAPSVPISPTRLLPGYDFITDLDSANDGDGRDGNATDPGDAVQAGECEEGAAAEDSSWHGTKVASLIAAQGDDNTGMAGVDWQASVLPVRVLGKCGGAVSDIVDGMLWAAGVSVPGVPDNEHPARVINVSIGGEAPEDGCIASLYQPALLEIVARNALVVVSAGNGEQEAANEVPASCYGVLSVAAVDHRGDLASYSNWSEEGHVHLSAPGGNIGRYDLSGAGLLVATDSGKNTASGELTHHFVGGTSFAAALVSGVASLALSTDPDQVSSLLRSVLVIGAHDFPEESDCARESFRCGGGIVDAAKVMEGMAIFKSYQVVQEFYHEELNHYFTTGNWDEISLVLRGKFGDWVPTDNLFLSWREQSEDGVLPVCRFYGTPGIGPNSHFYTVDQEECDKVKRDAGWTYEGVPFYAKQPNSDGECPENSVPVYRYYNMRWAENDSNHRYATHLDDQDVMEDKGWSLEGIAMCAPG